MTISLLLLLCLFWTTSHSIKFNIKKYISSKRPKFASASAVKKVTTRKEWDTALGDSVPLARILVSSNVSTIPTSHPTLQLLRDRLSSRSKPGRRTADDFEKVALCIEGGGMRGCVSAGASLALSFLGLNDVVDIVYGSSAGSMVGTYFISRQNNGNLIYQDILPQMGAVFLDKSKILEAVGVPPDVVTQAARLRSMMTAPSIDKVVRQTVRRLRSAAGRRAHTSSVHSLPSMTKLKKVAKELGIAEASLTNKGVINLSFLLDVLMGDLKALDWETFAENERVQPLRIIASCAKSLNSHVLSRESGNFWNRSTLLHCLRASMLVPGVTESMMACEHSTSSPIPIRPIVNTSTGTIGSHWRSELRRLLRQSELTSTPTRKPMNMLREWLLRRTSTPWIISFVNYRRLVSMLWRWRLPSYFFWRRAEHRGADNDEYQSSASPRSPGEKNGGIRSITDPFPLKAPKSPQRVHSKSATHLSHHHRPQVMPTTAASLLSYAAISPLATLEAPTAAMSTDDAWSNSSSSLLCDALLCEPIPYRSAVREGATHCIVLRSRPEPCHVLGKGPGVYEQLIARRFFHQYNATDAVDWMMSLQHQRIYAEDVLLMNEAAAGPLDGVQFEDRSVHLLPIAVGAEHRNNEIGQLETRREKIYDGLRQGARRVLEVFVPLLLTLETLPAALAPPLVARFQGYRASINSEDSFVDATEVSCDAILEMLLPASAMLKPPRHISELCRELSSSRGRSIFDDEEGSEASNASPSDI